MATKKPSNGAGKGKAPKPKRGKPWAKQKKTATTILAAQRKARALELRMQGRTFNQIAADLKITDGRVSQILSEALRELSEQRLESAESYRDLELAKLDALESRTNALFDAADSQAAVLSVIGTLLKIHERRAKLLALDAPTKVQAALTGPDGGPLAHGVVIVPGMATDVATWEKQAREAMQRQKELQREHEAALDALVPKGSGPDLA